MTGTEVTGVPFTAWQQAVFVVLIIMLIVWVLSWMAKREEKHEVRTQAFQKSESDKWQKHMTEENDKWRKFNQDQREQNNCAMGEVQKSLSDIATVTGKLVQTVDEMRADIYKHDIQAKEILKEVQNPTRLRTTKRELSK